MLLDRCDHLYAISSNSSMKNSLELSHPARVLYHPISENRVTRKTVNYNQPSFCSPLNMATKGFKSVTDIQGFVVVRSLNFPDSVLTFIKVEDKGLIYCPLIIKASCLFVA